MVEAGSYTVTYDASNRCLSARSIAALPSNILCQDHALLWREDTQSWYESLNFVWTPISFAGEGITWPLLAPDGSSSAPSYSFENATGTGMYSNSSNKLNFSVGGLFALQFDDNGQVDMGGATVVSGAVGSSTYLGAHAAAGRTDTAGGALFLHGGIGTGSGAGGNFISTVATPSSTGSTQNTQREWLRVTGSNGAVSIGINSQSSGVFPVPALSWLTGTWRLNTVTDGVGGDLQLSSGAGTGAAAATSIALQTPTVGASGTSHQTLATRMTVATASITDTVPYINSTTTSIGWSVVAGADTACNTTCTNACVFGWNLTAANITGTLLACTDATADACLCAGAN
jgi:hypothetical protein